MKASSPQAPETAKPSLPRSPRAALSPRRGLSALADPLANLGIGDGFGVVILLQVALAGAAWPGFEETTNGMASSQESSDAAITAASMEGRTADALYFAQKFMASGDPGAAARAGRDAKRPLP